MEMSISHEVIIQSAYPLSGTLTIPNQVKTTYTTNGTLTHPSGMKTNYPAVLIVSGSGKGDRDGNLKNMKMNVYKDLANFLTLKGFITLRYDKRGTHQSGGNFHETGLYDLIEDAVQCVNFLQNHPKVDREKVLILGHSEGALIAPAVHKQVPVSGLVLLAGAAEPSKDLTPRQSEKVYEEMNEIKGFKGWLFRTFKVIEKARKQNEKVLQKVTESDKAVMRIKGIKLNAKWLRETMSYNVCEYLEEVTCPVLAITGEKDLQVPPDHARLIADIVKGESEWHVITDMNHMLRTYEGEHTMLRLMKEYKTQLNQPIDRELFDKMTAWLEKYYNTELLNA